MNKLDYHSDLTFLKWESTYAVSQREQTNNHMDKTNKLLLSCQRCQGHMSSLMHMVHTSFFRDGSFPLNHIKVLVSMSSNPESLRETHQWRESSHGN
jgi:hypothetical protein